MGKVILIFLTLIFVILIGCVEQIPDEQINTELDDLSEEEFIWVVTEDKPALVGEAERPTLDRINTLRRAVKSAAKLPLKCADDGEQLTFTRGSWSRSIPKLFCSNDNARERICNPPPADGFTSTLTICENGCDVSTGRCIAPVIVSPIDLYLTCPTQQEKDLIERDFDIRFYNTPGRTMSWGDFPYQCDYTIFTSTNPTRVKTYNTIRFLKNIQFSQSLPFTQGGSLYEFLTLQTTSNPTHPKLGIEPRLECDLYSSGGLFSLTLSGNFARWYPVLSGSDTCELGFGPPSNMLVNDFAYHPLYAAELFVHESYHAIVESPHTGVSGGDATIQEMGAWAAQFYFNAWIALYSTNLDDNTKQLARNNAIAILQTRFTENNCPDARGLKEVVNQIIPNLCP